MSTNFWIYPGLIINVGAIVFMGAGIQMIRKNINGTFTLNRRALLRNEFLNGFKKKSSTFRKQVNKWPLITPVLEMIKNNRNQKKDKEIFEAITFLRNMASIGKGKTTSTDYIIQMLAEHKGILQPTYTKMLSLLRLNRKDEASLFFYEQIQTPISKDFSRLLIQWDEIDPSELSETLLSYEKSIKEIRITNQKRRDEIVSDLIYFPVVMNVLVIFINFIYVAYLIEQKEMLQMFI